MNYHDAFDKYFCLMSLHIGVDKLEWNPPVKEWRQLDTTYIMRCDCLKYLTLWYGVTISKMIYPTYSDLKIILPVKPLVFLVSTKVYFWNWFNLSQVNSPPRVEFFVSAGTAVSIIVCVTYTINCSAAYTIIPYTALICLFSKCKIIWNDICNYVNQPLVTLKVWSEKISELRV